MVSGSGFFEITFCKYVVEGRQRLVIAGNRTLVGFTNSIVVEMVYAALIVVDVITTYHK